MKRQLITIAGPLLLLSFTNVAAADDATVPSPPASLPGSAPVAAPKNIELTLHVDDAHAHLEQRTATMTSSDPVTQQMGFGGFDTWKTVCTAPCDVPVDASGVYRVAGDGLVPSGSFGLSGMSDKVRLDSRSGSSFERIGGAILAGAGAAGVLVGGGAFGAAFIMDHDASGSAALRDSLRYGGAAMAGAGAIAAVVGAYFFLTNDTHVRTDTGVQVGSGPKVTGAGLVF